jgi:hypothetical protein
MVRWLIPRKSKELEATYRECEEPNITAIIYAIYCNLRNYGLWIDYDAD